MRKWLHVPYRKELNLLIELEILATLVFRKNIWSYIKTSLMNLTRDQHTTWSKYRLTLVLGSLDPIF